MQQDEQDKQECEDLAGTIEQPVQADEAQIVVVPDEIEQQLQAEQQKAEEYLKSTQAHAGGLCELSSAHEPGAGRGSHYSPDRTAQATLAGAR